MGFGWYHARFLVASVIPSWGIMVQKARKFSGVSLVGVTIVFFSGMFQQQTWHVYPLHLDIPRTRITKVAQRLMLPFATRNSNGTLNLCPYQLIISLSFRDVGRVHRFLVQQRCLCIFLGPLVYILDKASPFPPLSSVLHSAAMKLSLWLIEALLLAFPFAVNGAVLKIDAVSPDGSIEDPGCSPGKLAHSNIYSVLIYLRSLLFQSRTSSSRSYVLQPETNGIIPSDAKPISSMSWC